VASTLAFLVVVVGTVAVAVAVVLVGFGRRKMPLGPS